MISVGSTIVLQFKDGLAAEKVRGALFQNGDRGVVRKPSRTYDNGWIVEMNGQYILLFADEMEEA